MLMKKMYFVTVKEYFNILSREWVEPQNLDEYVKAMKDKYWKESLNHTLFIQIEECMKKVEPGFTEQEIEEFLKGRG